eukprot:129470-Pyramimonas_sp.AAC.1
MQLVSAPQPGLVFDAWTPPGAVRRWENQLREPILTPLFAVPPFRRARQTARAWIRWEVNYRIGA